VHLQDLNLIKGFRLGIYSFTFLLVLAMGFGVYLSMGIDSLIRTSPTKSPGQNPSERRIPASVELGSSGVADPLGLAPVSLEVYCSDVSARPTFAVKTSHLRLKTKNCEMKSVTNETNGFQATLFEVGKRKYSSDYISLAGGENQISMVRLVEGAAPVVIRLSVVSQ